MNRRRTRILYGITPESSLEEEILDHLRGYEDSRPVRIGNGAAEHLQLDVFGEVIATIHSLLVLNGEIPEEAWDLVCSFAEVVIKNWHRRDRGVWEVRGEPQNFVYSKVMCWAALDTAAYIAAAVEQRRLYRRWAHMGVRDQDGDTRPGMERFEARVQAAVRQRCPGRLQSGDSLLRVHPIRRPAGTAEPRRHRAGTDRRATGMALHPGRDGRRPRRAAGGSLYNVEFLAAGEFDLHGADRQGLRPVPRDDDAVLQPPGPVRGDVRSLD